MALFRASWPDAFPGRRTAARRGRHPRGRSRVLRPRLLGGEIATPNLDALAAGGLQFTQFWHRRCWPSRAALLMGYYAQQVNRDPGQKRPRRGAAASCPSCSGRRATARITRASGTSTDRCWQGALRGRTWSSIRIGTSRPGTTSSTIARCRSRSRRMAITPPSRSLSTRSTSSPGTTPSIAAIPSFCTLPSRSPTSR